MYLFFKRRLLSIIPMLLGITLITFGVMHLAPGKPVDQITDMNMKVSAEAKQQLIRLYGLDKPWYVQYASWLKRIVKLDLGNSFKDGRPAIKKIAERLPATLLLNFVSLALILGIAIPIGIISALKHNTIIDRVLSVFVFIGFSLPTFWLALMLMIVFGLKLGVLPISGLYALNHDEMTFMQRIFDMAHHLILPALVSAFTGLAGLSRYVRSGMLDVLRQDYIRFAYAKGLSKSRIIFRHAASNALLPVITILGLSLPGLIGGGFIFETIFAYPGMGRLGYDAIMARDYPVIMAVGLIAALLTLVGNLIADISYAWADPRIRYK